MDKLKDLISRSGITLGKKSKIHFITGNDNKTQTVLALDAFYEGNFKAWQELQNIQKFRIGEKIISLIRLKEKHKWLFAGVYSVVSVTPLSKGEPDRTWHPEGVPKPCFEYSTELSGLGDLVGRAVIQYDKPKDLRNACLFPETRDCYDNLVVIEIRDQTISGNDEAINEKSLKEAVKAADLFEPPHRIKFEVTRIVRDTAQTQSVKKLHEYKCQLCGMVIQLPDGTKYNEAHHIKPLGSGHDGPDVTKNIIVVCPNHHAMLDLGAIEIKIRDISPGHDISLEFIEYHNTIIYKSIPKHQC